MGLQVNLAKHIHFLWHFLLFSNVIDFTNGIDCFRCVSKNGDKKWCEDPFHNNYTSTVLHSPCWTGRKDRNGIFPATACIKINGIFTDNGETIFIRDCALDSGTLTTDTELVRMSHCGGFVFEDRYATGCVQACNVDACNGGSFKVSRLTWPWLLAITCFLLAGVKSQLKVLLSSCLSIVQFTWRTVAGDSY